MTEDRHSTAFPTVGDDRLRKARTAEALFDAFCHALGIPPTEPDSCVLYLAHLMEAEGLSGAQLDRRLTFIDVARRVDGREPLRANRHIRVFVRGLLRTARLHIPRELSDPIYREHLAALVEQTMRPTPKQTRLCAAVMLLHHTSWPAVMVARLRWRDLDLRRPDRTVIHWPTRGSYAPRSDIRVDHPPSRDPLRLALDSVAALNDGPFVTFPPAEYHPSAAPFLVTKAVRALQATGGEPGEATKLVSTSPEQIRNRAALIIGFGAALTLKEGLALTQRDIAVTSTGLLVTIPGRRRPVGIHRDPGTLVDPVGAWENWLDEMSSWDLRDDSRPAFLDAHKRGVYPRGIGERGLERLVQDPANALGMKGNFSWQSLRWGAIRSAIRDNERRHQVAALAATSLDTVNVHYRRESLIKHSVAGQLGL
jgi:hypothetical protein